MQLVGPGEVEPRPRTNGLWDTFATSLPKLFIVFIHILLPVLGHVQPLLFARNYLLPGERLLCGFLRKLTATVESMSIGARREGTGGRTEGYRVGIFTRLPVQRNRVRGVC